MNKFKRETAVLPIEIFSLPPGPSWRAKGPWPICFAIGLLLGIGSAPHPVHADSSSHAKPGWYMGSVEVGATLALRLTPQSGDRTYRVTGIFGYPSSTKLQFPVLGEYDPGSNLLAAWMVNKNGKGPRCPIVGSYASASHALNVTVSTSSGAKIKFSCLRARQPEKSLAGKWTMTDGTVIHVQQDGTTVTGTFAGAAAGISGGHLQGEFDGTTFKGNFSNKLNLGGNPMSIRGTFIMTLIAADKLQGRWTATNGASEDLTATRTP